MRPHVVDIVPRSPAHLTRRSFLQAIGLAFARSLHPVAIGFTAVADDLVWLMRWCCRGATPRFVGAA